MSEIVRTTQARQLAPACTLAGLACGQCAATCSHRPATMGALDLSSFTSGLTIPAWLKDWRVLAGLAVLAVLVIGTGARRKGRAGSRRRKLIRRLEIETKAQKELAKI